MNFLAEGEIVFILLCRFFFARNHFAFHLGLFLKQLSQQIPYIGILIDHLCDDVARALQGFINRLHYIGHKSCCGFGRIAFLLFEYQ